MNVGVLEYCGEIIIGLWAGYCAHDATLYIVQIRESDGWNHLILSPDQFKPIGKL